MSTINRCSLVLEKVFIVFMITLPIATAFLWIFADTVPIDMLASGLPFNPIRSTSLGISYTQHSMQNVESNLQLITLTPTTRCLAFLISMLPVSVLVYIFNNLRKLFQYYAREDYFTNKHIKIFKQLGYSIFAWVFMTIIDQLLMSYALTYLNPPGSRVISLQLSSSDIFYCVVGLIVVVISHVMQKGVELSDEQAHTV